MKTTQQKTDQVEIVDLNEHLNSDQKYTLVEIHVTLESELKSYLIVYQYNEHSDKKYDIKANLECHSDNDQFSFEFLDELKRKLKLSEMWREYNESNNYL